MDEFDAIVRLEETWHREGMQEGVVEGRVQGKEQGYLLGEEKGQELGHEIGFYQGCVEIWKEGIEKKQLDWSESLQKTLQTLEEMLLVFPLHNVHTEEQMNLLLRLRAKFKILTVRGQMKTVSFHEIKDDERKYSF